MPATLPAVTFQPALAPGDPLANHWLREVTVRLRREVCWLWHERSPGISGAPGALPPFSDRLSATLDQTRYAEQKAAFFREDETAAFLSGLLTPPPRLSGAGAPVVVSGSFAWLVRELAFEPVECFLLALGLLPAIDSTATSVIAAIHNDPARTQPTLSLAQRLWDNPAELLRIADRQHALFRHAILQVAIPAAAGEAAGHVDWDTPFFLPAAIARQLAYPERAIRPSGNVQPGGAQLPEGVELTVSRLKCAPPHQLRVIPLLGGKGAPFAATAEALGRRLEMPVTQLGDASPAALPVAITLAWLRGQALYATFEADRADEHHRPAPLLPAGLPPVPVTLIVGLTDKTLLKRLGAAACVLPALALPQLTFAQRRDLWSEQLGERLAAGLDDGIQECARRYRCERDTIVALARGLRGLNRPLQDDDLHAACRAELQFDIGELAQRVEPRFDFEELMLPARQHRTLQEIVRAMENLATVHYDWGTARAWNESGLSALFAGPPGTGKTMAAEALASRLKLPLFRIDLSQVVNKYIGETEKNLRRLFDAADAADVILFFDEADSLFGKRTEVRDAHDRYANLEVSYLLERMERFKGLAILATNRKRDLDEAFLRRLRYVIDFPLPGAEERQRIWRQVMPEGANADGLDFSFLAQRFPLAGGHIRSAVFNACLQSAGNGTGRELTMPAVLAAVKREYEKLDRTIALDQFGPYAAAIRNLETLPEHENAPAH